MALKNLRGKILLIICTLPLIGLCIYCSQKVHDLAAEREAIKYDYSDINNITYGVLSVDAWKQNIEGILTKGIQEFELTQAQRDTLEVAINGVLRNTITQADSMLRSNRSFKGKLTALVYKTFVNKDDFMKKTPMFSKGIVDEMLKKKNKERFKQVAVEKLHLFALQTYGDTTDIYRMMPVLVKYQATSKEDFNIYSSAHIAYLQKQSYIYSFMVLGIILLFLLGWIIVYRQRGLERMYFGISVIIALIVLFVGLTSPMIEIDARIASIDFSLLGTHLEFKDQVLFYQSKSIIGVVQTLLRTGALDSIAVGFLILAFSILFPIAKLLSTQVYLFGGQSWMKNRVIYFFAFRSGKWSMADVMVVAIFMAYIGFKGILNSQMAGLSFSTPTLRSIATNLTSLQPAFILFLAYVIYGLILSEILKRIHKKRVAI